MWLIEQARALGSTIKGALQGLVRIVTNYYVNVSATSYPPREQPSPTNRAPLLTPEQQREAQEVDAVEQGSPPKEERQEDSTGYRAAPQ